MERVIKPSEAILNAISADSLFLSAANALRAEAHPRDCVVDLSDITFFDPYAVVAVCTLIEHLRLEGVALPRVLLPRNPSARHYLERVGLIEKLSEMTDVIYESASEPEEDSEILLELTRIDSLQSIEVATEKLVSLIDKNLGYQQKSLIAVTNAISELCSNILDHSGTRGWAMAQRYRRQDGSRFLWIGVADVGVGIKASLSGRHNTSTWTHADAIVNALKKTVSRFPQRGMGLHMVKRIVFDFGGTLHIRTGDARLYVAKTPRQFSGAWFPGTQAGVSLSEHPGA